MTREQQIKEDYTRYRIAHLEELIAPLKKYEEELKRLKMELNN